MMPCNRESRQLLSARCWSPSENRRDIWGAVIEKAFAKVLGSYSALLNSTASGGGAGGLSSLSSSSSSSSCHDQLDALLDLTGGVVERLDWKSKEVGVFTELQTALQKDAKRKSYEMINIAVMLSSAPQRSQQQQSTISFANVNTNTNSNHDLMTHLGLLPGHCYRVLATTTAENTRMILLDDLYYSYHSNDNNNNDDGGNHNNNNPDLKHHSKHAENVGHHLIHTSNNNGEDLPIRGLGQWSRQRQWQDHPLISNACRQELQKVIKLYFSTTNTSSSSSSNNRHHNHNNNHNNKSSSKLTGETHAILKKRLVWLDWRDAIFCFEGAGILKVAPELSLVSSTDQQHQDAANTNTTTPAREEQHLHQLNNNNDNNNTTTPNPLMAIEGQQPQNQNSVTQTPTSFAAMSPSPIPRGSSTLLSSSINGGHPYHHSSHHHHSHNAAPNFTIPRNILHRSTLDIRLPNCFRGAQPDWMLEIHVPLPSPVAAPATTTTTTATTFIQQQQQQATATPATTSASTYDPFGFGSASMQPPVSSLPNPNPNPPTATATTTPSITLPPRPVTLYIGLHQRDRRGLDPMMSSSTSTTNNNNTNNNDRSSSSSYSAMLLTVVGQSANSGVWDTVAHSHNGTFWRGRDVQLEVTLEPRAKPYYILPRRYASGSAMSNNGINSTSTSTTASSLLTLSHSKYEKSFLKNTATKEERMRAEKQLELEAQQQNEDKKEFIMSLIVPDGCRNNNNQNSNNSNTSLVSPSRLAFKKPTQDIMKAVRYSPVWRFDPDSCSRIDLNEYCVDLQKPKNNIHKKTKNVDDDDNINIEHHFEPHYFFRTVRSSLTIVPVSASSSKNKSSKVRNNIGESYSSDTTSSDSDASDDRDSEVYGVVDAINNANKKKQDRMLDRENDEEDDEEEEQEEEEQDDDENENEDQIKPFKVSKKQGNKSKKNNNKSDEDDNDEDDDSFVALKTVAVINRVPKEKLEW